MKSKTHVWIGLRNVGDSRPPQIFDGTVSESILWLAKQIGEVYMRNGLKIYIARTKEDVQAGLDLKRGRSTRENEELSEMLRQVLEANDSYEDDDESPENSNTSKPRLEGDDYQETSALDDWQPE